jgi:hypothetical protein
MSALGTLLRFGTTVAATVAASFVLSSCATTGQAGSSAEAPHTEAAQAGAAASRRGNPFVLTSAEIAASPSLLNAYDAVQALRPHFLRTRGAVSASGGGLLGGGSTAPAGRRNGQGNQPSGSGEPAGARGAPPVPEDVGILVYLDRQRYGRIETLREIPLATVEEIRFLNVGEANNQFGMGHPHGAIQVITKRRAPE